MFATFEGIEGAGKSTLMAAVAAVLEERAIPHVVTREPGGTPFGERLRDIFVDRSTSIEPWAEVFLLLASRMQLVRAVIAPALQRGETVLCDRFYDATLAYQGFGRGLDRERLLDLSLMASGGLVPNVTFVLDIAPELSAARLASRAATGDHADRLEREGLDFHRRVRDGYRSMAAESARMMLLDGTLPVADLAARVVQRLTAAP